jgi:peptidoglycan/LPS O-acetylase OafA/YrhL
MGPARTLKGSNAAAVVAVPWERPVTMRRIVELDGLRGLAAILVLVAHYFGEVPGGVRGLAAGWIGVDVFFVLSGFLIGGILIENRDSPTYFAAFYLRRAFRTLPAYVAMLVLTLSALALIGKQPWIDPALPSAIYLTYAQNFVMAWRDAHSNLWLLPTWTLAVEEQFYLILPLILFALPRRHIVPVLLVLIATGPCTRAVFGETMAGLTLLPSRWDLLFLGVLAAQLQRHGQIAAPMLKVLCVAAAIGTVAASIGPSIVRHVIGPSFIAATIAAYILLILCGAEEGRWLRTPVLTRVGLISYGLYLVHQPLNGLWHGLVLHGRPAVETPLQVVVTLAALMTSLALATLSWCLFERPLVNYGRRFRYAERVHPVYPENTSETIPSSSRMTAQFT